MTTDRLIFEQGPQAGQSVPLTGTPIVLGRGGAAQQHCDLQLFLHAGG